jgi:signal transduction histidine kinase
MLVPKGRGPAQGIERLDLDWAICLVRWGLIAGIPLLALLDPSQPLANSHLAYALIASSAYNMVITLLLVIGFFPRFVPPATIVLDTILIAALMHFSGGIESPYFFYPLFPILIAALRLGWQFGLAVAAVYLLGLAVWTALGWVEGLGLSQAFRPALYGALYLLATAVGGIVPLQATSQLEDEGAGWSASENSFVPDRVKMVYEMASTLSATLNYQRVLDAILDISRLGFDEFGQRVGESVGLVLLYDNDGLLSVASHRNLVVQKDGSIRIKGRQGVLEQSIGSAQATIGGPPSQDQELKAFKSLSTCKSMICVPLRAGFETYGAVLFASVKPNAYTTAHKDLLTIFCNQATVALQNASLYQSLREERDKIIDKEEQARHKLARDLHDGPTQDVAAIAMRLNFARLLVERDPVRAKAELARLEDLAHRTVREIRSMLFTLRPVILETEGLVAALNQYAENLEDTDGLLVEVNAENYEDYLDIEAQGVIFAIMEEAINNARKHSEGTRIWVQLAVERDLFVGQVIDNGRGFDVAAVERDYASRGSLGMINLRERAELVEGTISIESAPGQGTRITLIVPIDRDPI